MTQVRRNPPTLLNGPVPDAYDEPKEAHAEQNQHDKQASETTCCPCELNIGSRRHDKALFVRELGGESE